jgi:phospholipid/cholesterol/gamma-HCH transport system permease protein
MATDRSGSVALRAIERTGRGTAQILDTFGYAVSLFSQALYWIAIGGRRGQKVRVESIFAEMMEVGVRALPIVSLLTFTIGIVLAMQGVDLLRPFGAEQQVGIGVALGATREFAPLITGILVAGRSGSALAARIGFMTISEEVAALKVMGINPVRFLVAPALVAMVVMLPSLTVVADFVALLGAGLFITTDLGMTMSAYVAQTLDALSVDDVMHGLSKSVIFAVVITVIGVVEGATVKGGAEGVGRATTSSVVKAISAIVLTDMFFVAATR